VSGTAELEPTVEEVQARIARVRQLVTAGASIEELALAIKAVHRGCSIQMAGLKRGDFLFRAKRITERPTHRSQISYPPAERLNVFGRANDIRQPMFYACTANQHPHRDHDNRIACLWESRAEIGQVFAISMWQVEEDIPLYPFGFHVDAILNSPFNQKSGRATDPVITGGSPRDALLVIQRWESTAFTEIVPAGEEALYKFTVAMTKYALDLRWPVGSAGPGPNDRVSGIMYPSVANRLCVENVCLRPEEADRVLTLLDVIILSPSEMREFDLANRLSVEEPIGMAQVRLFESSLPCNRSPDIRWPFRIVLSSEFDVGSNTISAGSQLRAWSGTHPLSKQIK
jgi:hypothetical protein